MNIKSLFVFEKKNDKIVKISSSDKFFTTLFEILEGKRMKYMGDLAYSFGLYFKKLNLEKSDILVVTLFSMLRNIKLQQPPGNIKAFIYNRAIINKLISGHKQEEAKILNILFENCYHIIFKTNKREDIIKRLNNFSVFFENILLQIPVN